MISYIGCNLFLKQLCVHQILKDYINRNIDAAPFCSTCSKLNERPAHSLNKINDVLKMLSSTIETSASFKSSVSITSQ